MTQKRIDNQLRDLAELEFLSGSLESVDEFTSLYEQLLAKALVAGDQATAASMKKILLRQVIFLVGEREKAVNNNDDMANHQ